MPLCTEANVETVLRLDITDGEADDLIDLVSGYLEGYLGRTFDEDTPINATLTVEDTTTHELLTKHWPLLSVDAVTEDGTVLTEGTEYTADLDTGILYRLVSGDRAFWTRGHKIVAVTYTPATPGDLRALTARIVARIWRAGETRDTLVTDHPELEGLTQLTVGQWSATVSREQIDPAGLFDLNEIDLHILDGYFDRIP